MFVREINGGGQEFVAMIPPMRHPNRISEQERSRNRLVRLIQRTTTLWALRVFAMKLALRDLRRPLSEGLHMRARVERTSSAIRRREAKLARIARSGGVR
jgi:hypothetical protein